MRIIEGSNPNPMHRCKGVGGRHAETGSRGSLTRSTDCFRVDLSTETNSTLPHVGQAGEGLRARGKNAPNTSGGGNRCRKTRTSVSAHMWLTH